MICDDCDLEGKTIEMIQGHDCYKCPECGAEIIKACGERWSCLSAEAIKRREEFLRNYRLGGLRDGNGRVPEPANEERASYHGCVTRRHTNLHKAVGET